MKFIRGVDIDGDEFVIPIESVHLSETSIDPENRDEGREKRYWLYFFQNQRRELTEEWYTTIKKAILSS